MVILFTASQSLKMQFHIHFLLFGKKSNNFNTFNMRSAQKFNHTTLQISPLDILKQVRRQKLQMEHFTTSAHICNNTTILQRGKLQNKSKDPNRPVSSVDKTLQSMREVWGSNCGSVKSDTVSPTARLRCNASSELYCPGRDRPHHSLHTLA